jgi:hypothetical protein
MIDVDHEAVVMAEEPDHEPLFGAIPLAADHDAVTVFIGGRAGDWRLDGRVGEMADAAEQFDDLTAFEFELPFIAQVLVLAAATGAEIGAGGGDPVRRRVEEAEEAGSGIVFVDFRNGDFGLFAWQDERDEDDALFMAGDAFPSEREIDHLYDEVLTWLKWHVWRREHPGGAKTSWRER